MKKIFEQLLDNLIENKVITEDKKTSLVENFDKKLQEYREDAFKAASEKIDEEHAELFEKAINKLNEIHSNKLQNLYEKIDDLTAKKFQFAIDKIDEDHSNKLQQIIEHFQNKTDNEMIDKVSAFLDEHLEETLPEKVMIAEERLNNQEATINKIKEILIGNDLNINEEFKEALVDGKQIIESKDSEIDKLMLEKIELKQKLKKLETQKVFEDKIKDCSPKLKAFLEKYFEDADKEEIEEKFDEAVKAFEDDESTTRQQLQEENVNEGVVPKIINVEEQVENENAKDKNVDPIMEQYVSGVKRITKRM